MTTLHIPQGAKRIVCLTEEPTEILYALGEEDRIVGISAYTVRPPEAKENKPVVSAFIGGSVKKIKALNPDLVIGFSDIQADLAKQLIAANLQVLIFNQRSIQDILEVIVDIDSLVEKREEAKSLVSSYIKKIEEVSDRVSSRLYRPKVYFEEWDDPLICGIEWVSEIIEIAGGSDVFKEKARGRSATERIVSAVEIADLNPEVFLASWCGKPFDLNAVLGRKELQEIPAIQKHNIYEIPAEIILQPGPASLTEGLDCVERLLQQSIENETK